MSKLVDERVVELKFDNSNFERNTRQSMATVREMKSSLNFSGMASSINTAINSVNFSPITDSLETTKKSFDALEVVAINVLSRITQDAITAGKQLIESLSIDNASTGWEKYESLAKSIGTLVKILTSSMSEEEAMEEATKYMNKLMYYSDATSYSIEQMASAFSTLVNKGMNLQDAYEAVIGISNWAAASGKDINETAAIYQALSKASGHVTGELMRSIRLAKMDTVEWKQAILEAAVAAGTLNKGIENFDGTIEYTTKNGKIVSIENFSDALEDGWFLVDEVLMKTLKDYGMAVDKVSEYQESNNLETPFDALEKYTEELKLAREEALALGDAEKVSAIDAELFSLKTFDAASEARTLTDAIRATKDAVSTGWTKAFTSLTGNYVEATELFSDFADELTAIFTASTTAINNALSLWRGYTPEVIEEQKKLQEQEKYLLDNRKELTKEQIKEYEEEINAHKEYIKSIIAQNDHRVDLFGNKGDEDQGALWNLLDAIKLVVSAIKDAWKDVFPVKKSLGEITESIKEFTKNLIPSEEGLETIKGIFRGLFAILKLGKKIIEGVFAAIKPIKDTILESSGSILGFLGKIGNKFADWVDNLTIFKKIGTAVGNAIKDIINVFKELKIIDKVKESFAKLGEELKERFNGKGELGKALDSLKENFTAIWKTLLSGLKEFLKFMVNNVLPIMINAIKYVVIFASYVVKGVKIALEKIIEVVSKFIETVKANENVQNGWKSFIDFMKSIPSKLSKLEPFFKKLGSVLSSFFKVLWNGIVKVGEALSKVINFKSLGDLFAKIGEKIKYGFDKIVEGIKSLSSAKLGKTMNGISKEMTPLQTLFKGLIDLFIGLKNIFLALMVVIGSVLSTIGNMLTTLGENLKALFNKKLASGAKGLDIWAIVNGAIVALIAKGLYEFVWLFRSITNVIKDTIDSVGSVFRAKAILQWAEAIKKVAQAILILVAALLLITLIDEQELRRAIGVLAAIMGLLTACIVIIGHFMDTAYSMKADALFEKGFLGSFSRTGNSWGGVARMILSFGLAILALVAALKILGSIKEAQLAKGLLVLSILMALLTAAMGLMNSLSNLGNKTGKPTKGIKGMLSFSISVIILAKSLEKMGNIPVNKLFTSLGAVALIFTMLSLYGLAVRSISNDGMKSITKSMYLVITIVLATALLYRAMKTVDIETIGRTALALGIMIVTTFTVLLLAKKFADYVDEDDTAHIIKTLKILGVILGALVLAVYGIAQAAKVFSSVSWEGFGMAMATLGILWTMMIITMTTLLLISKKMRNTSELITVAGVFIAVLTALIIALSVVCDLINGPIKDMNEMDMLKGIGLFVIIIIGVLILLEALSSVLSRYKFNGNGGMKKAKDISKSLLVIGLALSAVAVSLISILLISKYLNNIKPEGFKNIAIAFTILLVFAGIIMGISVALSKTLDEKTIKGVIKPILYFGIIMGTMALLAKELAGAALIFSMVQPNATKRMYLSVIGIVSLAMILIVSLNALTKYVNDSNKLLKSILYFGIIIGSLAILVQQIGIAAIVFSVVSSSTVKRIVGTIVALITIATIAFIAISVLSQHINDMSKMAKTIAIFGIVVGGMVILIDTMFRIIEKYNGVNMSNLGPMLGALSAIIALSAAIFILCSKIKFKPETITNLYAIATLLGTLGLVMAGFALLLSVVNTMNINTIIITLLLIAAAISGLMLFASLAGGSQKDSLKSGAKTLIELGIAFLLFSAGAAAFAVATSLLTMNLTGLLVFAGILLALGVAGKLLGSAAPSLLLVGVAFLSIGAACLALATGFYLISQSLIDLLPVLDELAEKGDQITTVVAAVIAGVVEGIANALPILVTKLLEAVDILIQDLLSKILAFAQWFLKLKVTDIKPYLDKFNEILGLILYEGLAFLNENAVIFTQTVVEFILGVIIGIIKGLTNRMPEIMESVAEFIIVFFESASYTLDKYGQRITDSIMMFIDSLWAFIWNYFGNLFYTIGNNLDKYIWTPIRNWWNNFVSNIQKGWDKLGRDLGNFFKNIGNSIRTGIQQAYNAINNWANGLLNNIGNFFKNLWNKIVKGIKDTWNAIGKAIGDFGNGAINFFKDILGINSPSRVFEEIGENVGEGFIIGIENESDAVEKSMNNMADAANDGFDLSPSDYYKQVENIYEVLSKALVDKAGIIYDTIKLIIDNSIAIINGSEDYFKESILNIVSIIENNITEDDLTIRPIMDLTEIQNGIIQMKSMLNDANSIRVEASSRAANTVSAERARAVWREHAESQNNSINPTSAGDVYNVTFNITGDNPKAIADEVSKVFQHKVSRRDPRW